MQETTTSPKGIELIKHFESLHDGDLSQVGLQPKMCPAGIWTVGWGHALWNAAKGTFLKGAKDRAAAYGLYPAMTTAEADALLRVDLRVYEAAVLKMIKRRDLNRDEFSALVAFCMNCGTHYVSRGKRVPFALWQNVDNRLGPEKMRTYWESSVIRVGNTILPGLQRRRKAEAHLYRTGQLKFFFN